MLPQPQPTRQRCAPAAPPPNNNPSACVDASAADYGVGIDTSRYGHYAAFLDGDLQTATAELAFAESAAGYEQLRQRLVTLAGRHPHVHFRVRLDCAGLYADNLLAFLERLRFDNADFTISVGDPQRNKNYRVSVYGRQKSDPIEARACARYALSERPQASARVSPALARLRQVATRLLAATRQRTRLINQLHQLLARTFPELALVTKDISVGWCRELLHRYPTARLLARATAADLQSIPYLPHARIADLLARARDSVGALDGSVMEELVRDQVRQVRDVHARQKRLENLMVSAYRDLPVPNHLDTIKGIGEVTAAVLTAFMLDVERFETPFKLVAYFGVLPIEASSGIDRDGKLRGPKRYVMSQRGNDLVRRYLWLAALTAARFNPACRALYARVRAKHPEQPSIAIGHVMRKLLHLAFAVWKSGQPFDPNHYRWEAPAHVDGSDNAVSVDQAIDSECDNEVSEENQAAGLTQSAEPARKEVTATRASTVAAPAQPVESPAANVWLDFAHLKSQLPMSRLLEHLGLSAKLKGSDVQKRCACPIHRGDGRGRTFSVNLSANVFQCFDARCQKQGDVIDLWAALHQQSLREAALDLVRTFDLEPAPPTRTEKRNG